MKKGKIADKLYGKEYDELDAFQQVQCDWYKDVSDSLNELRKYADDNDEVLGTSFFNMIASRIAKLKEIEDSVRRMEIKDMAKKANTNEEESIQREILEELKGLRKDISQMNYKLDVLNTPWETIK